MTLEEAIEIKETELGGSVEHSDEELREADMLSIEALNLVISFRNTHIAGYIPPLLGETEDYCKFCGIAHTGLECPDRGGEK